MVSRIVEKLSRHEGALSDAHVTQPSLVILDAIVADPARRDEEAVNTIIDITKALGRVARDSPSDLQEMMQLDTIAHYLKVTLFGRGFSLPHHHEN